MSAASVIPSEGAVKIVSDLGTYSNVSDNWNVGLFKNNVTVAFATVLADLSEADFDGYAQIGPLDWALGSVVGTAWQMIDSTTRQWTVSGGTNLPETIYGYFITDGTYIIACESLATPIVLTAIGQVIQILPTILIGNCP